MKKPIITFAGWGNYTLAFQTLLDQVGLEVIPPGKTNSATISEGSKMAPEMFCFPMKVTIGNYLPALRKGADTVFMAENVGGSCRQRYFGMIQEKVLKENGWKINFISLKITPKYIYSVLRELSGASFLRIFRAVRFFFKKLSLIEKIEAKAQYYRPREVEKGTTDGLVQWAFEELEKMDKEKYFPKLKKEVLRRFSRIRIEKKKRVPKVALIGEIYTVTDPTINFEVEKKLGNEGIEVHREMSLSYQLKKVVFPWMDWVIQRKINPYLKSTVGGHGRDAIYEMLHYIEKGFNGVVHLLPFGCMPEVTIRPILEKLHQESQIPFLSLSLDEQVAEAGINTRLEAFVDVVMNHYKSKRL